LSVAVCDVLVISTMPAFELSDLKYKKLASKLISIFKELHVSINLSNPSVPESGRGIVASPNLYKSGPANRKDVLKFLKSVILNY